MKGTIQSLKMITFYDVQLNTLHMNFDNMRPCVVSAIERTDEDCGPMFKDWNWSAVKMGTVGRRFGALVGGGEQAEV
jgi:hypothetical protein